MASREWELRRFELCLKDWMAADYPTVEMLGLAVQWAISRSIDPYRDATRVINGQPSHWVALVPVPPGCHDQVCAEFDILEEDHVVECDGITTLTASALGRF